jgi:hypothetical protein
MIQTARFFTRPGMAPRDRALRLRVSLLVGVSLLVLLTIGCAQGGSTTAIARPTTPPSKLVTFTGTLQLMGTNFYPITVTSPGYVEATLAGLEGPPATTVGLGIGNLTASGTCSLIYSVTTAAGTAAQVVGTGLSGTLCVTIYDVGHITAPTLYTITVASS